MIYEKTPNPQSMKFVVSEKIATKSHDFKTIHEAEGSPLAKKLFGFPWAESVFLGEDFLTITKQDWVEWDIIAEPLANLIKEHIQNKEPIFQELTQKKGTSNGSGPLFDKNDSDIVKSIKTVIHNEIKPAVAMDGGDIQFVKYEDHKVYIYMLGACSGCPSSTMTLKQGIEVRLKNALPEIQEVIALN